MSYKFPEERSSLSLSDKKEGAAKTRYVIWKENFWGKEVCQEQRVSLISLFKPTGFGITDPS